jgi:cyclic patellamide precursor peptide PatG
MEKGKDNSQDAGNDEPYRVRLPGFISDEESWRRGQAHHLRRWHKTLRRLRAPCRRPESLDGLYTLMRNGQTWARREDTMEQPETNDNAAIESVEAREASPAVTPARSVAGPVTAAQAGAPGCPTCGGVAGAQGGGTAIYALGQIGTRFPRPSVEKEVAQATGRAETAGQTDQQAFHEVLSRRENRYLARQLC